MATGHRYRLQLDESMEYEAIRRLSDAGHDVEHVTRLEDPGEGSPDSAICRWSLEDDGSS